MPFQKIEAEKLSAQVVRQIEQLILRGILRPGERFPSERDLAARLGVSRPSLRDALNTLEQQDLLTTRPGAGVFVADFLGSAFAAPLMRLFATHDEALFDYLTFRRDLEGLAAARAAHLASDTDLKTIATIFAKMERASRLGDPENEAKLDAEFHLSIIEASHNVVMLHMMRSMFQMLQAGVFYNRKIIFAQQTTRRALLAQHRDIHLALAARKPDLAQAAVNIHLDFVTAAMRDHKRAEQNESVAKLRLEHERRRS
ncbi:MAG: FCD domain-containing protein [Alphaproteobacteria bacterium]|nr:FCD domain-containing protein [Alphaproteobacteria bacterium]